jgi:hypothetical protein
MSTININEIYFVGSDLLCDPEICLDRLFDNNLISSVAIGLLFIVSMSFGYKVGRNYKC